MDVLVSHATLSLSATACLGMSKKEIILNFE